MKHQSLIALLICLFCYLSGVDQILPALGTAEAAVKRRATTTKKKPAAAKRSSKAKAKTIDQSGAKYGYRVNSYLWDLKTKTLKTKNARRIEIDLRHQRGYLYAGNVLVMNFPVTTGRVGKSTPRGSFRITEKKADKRSTLYGYWVNRKGQIIKSGVRSTQRRPRGVRFVGVKMPYWMRFNGAIGIHQGTLHSNPASNGCVRVPAVVAPVLYKNVPLGSAVIVR